MRRGDDRREEDRVRLLADTGRTNREPQSVAPRVTAGYAQKIKNSLSLEATIHFIGYRHWSNCRSGYLNNFVLPVYILFGRDIRRRYRGSRSRWCRDNQRKSHFRRGSGRWGRRMDFWCFRNWFASNRPTHYLIRVSDLFRTL